MARRLMILTRLLVLFIALTSLLALAVAGIESPPEWSGPVLSERWDSIHDENWAHQAGGATDLYLIERQGGRCNTVSLPGKGHWSALCVSPWTDPAGSGQAVGLYFIPPDQGESGGFLGLARLRLPEARIIDQVPVDVLPTSRPCWVPDRPGSIVFAAGDGQLYRQDFDDAAPLASSPQTDSAGRMPGPSLRRLAWNCPRPSHVAYYLTDPAWSTHPRLRHLLVVTLMSPPHPKDGKPMKGTQFWWLRMNRDGLTIDASGPLSDRLATRDTRETIQRYPTLIAGRTGEILLAYLTHEPGQRKGRLQAVAVQLDARTGEPSVLAASRRTITEECATLPPVFSADGASVFTLSDRSGQIMKSPVQPSTPPL